MRGRRIEFASLCPLSMTPPAELVVCMAGDDMEVGMGNLLSGDFAVGQGERDTSAAWKEGFEGAGDALSHLQKSAAFDGIEVGE